MAELAQAADSTASAGQLLEGLDEDAGTVAVPAPVTGPARAGLLPPRTGWKPLGATATDQVFPQLMSGVREFKERSAAVPEHHRKSGCCSTTWPTRSGRPARRRGRLPRGGPRGVRDRVLHPGTPLSAHRAGSWLRLNAPHGSVAVRAAAAPGAGLGLTPLL